MSVWLQAESRSICNLIFAHRSPTTGFFLPNLFENVIFMLVADEFRYVCTFLMSNTGGREGGSDIGRLGLTTLWQLATGLAG